MKIIPMEDYQNHYVGLAEKHVPLFSNYFEMSRGNLVQGY